MSGLNSVRMNSFTSSVPRSRSQDAPPGCGSSSISKSMNGQHFVSSVVHSASERTRSGEYRKAYPRSSSRISATLSLSIAISSRCRARSALLKTPRLQTIRLVSPARATAGESATANSTTAERIIDHLFQAFAASGGIGNRRGQRERDGVLAMQRRDPQAGAISGVPPVRGLAAPVEAQQNSPPKSALAPPAGKDAAKTSPIDIELAKNYFGEARRLAEKDGGTLLSYEVEAQIGGELAQLGQRLINGTAKKLADEFFANFDKAVQG